MARSLFTIVLGNGMTSSIKEDWRTYGEARRRALLRRDDEEGGTNFLLNQNCQIQRYFDVADRVLTQFRIMYENRCNMEEVYVMGHRLIIFLEDALPQHPDFDSSNPGVTFMRTKSFHDLDWIRKRLEVVALRIDEDQLNKFILNDLGDTMEEEKEPSVLDVSDAVNESFRSWSYSSSLAEDVSFETAQEELLSTPWEEATHWESFSGWNNNNNSHNTGIEKEEQEWQELGRYAPEICFESYEMDSDSHSSDFPDSESDIPRPAGYDALPEEESSFLRKIASEKVRYDSDSEAVDSWAQDDDFSLSANGQGQTSPRKAFQDMANHYNNNNIQYKSLGNKDPTMVASPNQQPSSPSSKTKKQQQQQAPEKENAKKWYEEPEDPASPRRRTRYAEAKRKLQLGRANNRTPTARP